MSNESKGPGQHQRRDGRGGPGGPGGDRGRGGPGGRHPERGGRGDRREGRGGRGREGGGAGHRIVTELPNLEKALTKGDLGLQKSSLEQLLKTLRSMRIRAFEDLDMDARGRLLTTLLRVQRQPRPEGFDDFLKSQTGAASAPQPAESQETAEAAAPAVQTADTGSAQEAAPPETTTGAPAEPAPEAAATPAPAEAAPETPAEGTSAGTPELDRRQAYQDVLYLVGRVWRAAGAPDRAQPAFELSGRPAPEKEEPLPEEAPKEAREGREKRERPMREGGERREKRERRPPRELVNIPVGGNWQEVAREYEQQGRTRDAARVYERNQAWLEAARLFEAGGSLRDALRCAIAAKDQERVKRLSRSMPLEQARPVLEKAGAWEILMELFVAAQDFENVAKLYERSRQFDQAAIAWERAGKLGAARKAYERARDFKNAQRVKNLEIDKLIERGDRLGAAQMLVSSGRKDEAVAILLALPAPKAYRFMERLKLDEAAKALALRELEKATQENKPSARARWLETLDESAQAAEAWVQAGRLERASVCNERAGNLKLAAEQAEAVGDLDRAQDLYRRAGDTENMNRVAALPRLSPEERKARQKVSAEEEAADAEHAQASAEAAAPLAGTEGSESPEQASSPEQEAAPAQAPEAEQTQEAETSADPSTAGSP